MQVAVCDDEKLFRAELCDALSEYKREKRVSVDIFEFENGQQLLDSKTVFDIVFMDYQMPGIDGLSAARNLRSKNSICSIIFVTSYPNFVFSSFEVQPFRFFVKPLDKNKLNDAIDSYIHQQKLLNPIIITEDGEQKTIPSEDIIYIEANGKYCLLRTKNDTHQSSKTISKVLELLPEHCFYRIHKSYAINMYFVSAIVGNEVFFINGEKAVIGRNHLKEFKKVYRSFVKNYYVKG